MKNAFWTTLAILGVILGWYLAADRITPFTSNARVKAIITPITPQVSGSVTEIRVSNGQIVEAGAVLAVIDPRPYENRRDKARADLASAIQDVGAGSAGVESAQAILSRAQADLETEKLQASRVFELEAKGLIAVAKADESRRRLSEREADVERAQADLESAKASLGSVDQNNPRIQRALADLADAELKLGWTTLTAPARGGISDLDIAAGSYASAGRNLMTFIDANNVWVEAYMTENNLGNVDIGDPADVVLDMHPGRVFKGKVASFSGGRSDGTTTKPGELASVPRAAGWLRTPQRLPVRIVLPGYTSGDETDDVRFNVNGQADVIVYTNDNVLLNTLARAYIRVVSWFSYAY